MGFREEYKDLRRDLDLVKVRQQVYTENRATAEGKLLKLRETLSLNNDEYQVLQQAYKALETVLKKINDVGRKGMEDTINKALKVAVPKRNYQVSVTDYVHGRNGLSTDITFISNQMGKDLNPKFQSGEAAKQILSVSLIFSFIAFAGKSRFIFFDESFGGVYGTNTRNIGKIIQTLAEINGFQIFLVNQNPTMFNVPGMRIIELELNDLDEGLIISRDYIVENEVGDIEDVESVVLV